MIMTNIRAAIANELHKQAQSNYPTRSVVLKNIGELFQIDLVDMIKYSTYNNGYKYIMTGIDCFSKFSYAVPLKTKKANDVVKALLPTLKKNKITHIQTDQGTEFFNIHVKNLFNKFKINHYATNSEKS